MNAATQRFLIENSPQIKELSQKFSGYTSRITKTNVEHFISQFKVDHLPLALKLLNNVDYYDAPTITDLARILGRDIKSLTNDSLNDVLICPIKPVSGTSTESIQRKLRLTMSSSSAERNSISQKIINFSDLETLSTEQQHKTIFFVDDFIGSGDTIIQSWGRVQIWENDNHIYFVGALVAYQDAIERIEEETGHHFEIVAPTKLPITSRAFHNNNTVFTEEEKKILKKYCEILPNKKEHRYGHRNGQSLVIFSEMAPNNALPILHQKSDKWIPLFPRYF